MADTTTLLEAAVMGMAVLTLIFKAWNYWRNGRRLPGKAQLKFVDGETMHKPV